MSGTSKLRRYDLVNFCFDKAYEKSTAEDNTVCFARQGKSIVTLSFCGVIKRISDSGECKKVVTIPETIKSSYTCLATSRRDIFAGTIFKAPKTSPDSQNNVFMYDRKLKLKQYFSFDSQSRRSSGKSTSYPRQL